MPTKSENVEAAVPAAEWPQIRGYMLEEAIGRGGMGRVFRARDQELGRTVAIKFLLHTGDLQLWARFAGEARAVAQLQHPNIARLYEFHADPNQPYLVMEYIGGGTLADLVGSRPIDAKLACQIVATLAHAIESAHRQGIVHRDLKPGNILIAESADAPAPSKVDAVDERIAIESTIRQGQASPTRVVATELDDGQGRQVAAPVKANPAAELQLEVTALRIADFGLAKHIASDTKHTRTGEVVGTPDYMSPEQATGVVAGIGPATDIYSLGAIFYKLLTGRPPFVGSDTVDTILMLLSDDPVAPRTLVPRVPVDVQTICLKCLEKNAARRYGSAKELAEDLERFIRGEAILARPISVVERLVKLCRRKPWQATAVGLLVACVLGAFIGVVLLNNANQKLKKSNIDLSNAIREADQAFELSQDSLNRIVDRVRNDLYEVPQAEKMTLETARDSANVHRSLHTLRPNDREMLHRFVKSLDIHRLTEWNIGDRTESAKAADELLQLIDKSCRRYPDDIYLASKQLNLWIDLSDQSNAMSDSRQRAEIEKKIESRLAELLKAHPNDAQLCKTASLQAQRKANEAAANSDLQTVIRHTRDRVEFSRRFARNSQKLEHLSALQWLIQSVITLAEYELAAGNHDSVTQLLDDAQSSLEECVERDGSKRDNQNFAAHIHATRGKLAVRQSDLEQSLEQFQAAHQIYKQLQTDFPDDMSVIAPLAGNNTDLAMVLIAAERPSEAANLLDEAESLTRRVLTATPDDYVANVNQQRIAALRQRLNPSAESAIPNPE